MLNQYEKDLYRTPNPLTPADRRQIGWQGIILCLAAIGMLILHLTPR